MKKRDQARLTPRQIMNLGEEHVLPRLRLDLDVADFGHEADDLHHVLRGHGELDVRIVDEFEHFVDGDLFLGDPHVGLGRAAAVLVDVLDRFVEGSEERALCDATIRSRMLRLPQATA